MAEQSQVLRWLVMIVLGLATAGMFVVSMRANYLYGYSIGQSPETQLAIAWANVGADLWKGLGLIVVVALWRGRSRKAATAIFLTWLVCLAFSVSSAIGIYVQERTALTSGREATHASYDDARKELARNEARLKSLGPQRTPAQVDAAIASVLARVVTTNERVRGTVGALSNTCTKHDVRTATECADIAKLREELAVAVEATRLGTRAEHLRQQVHALRDRGGAAAPDPVGEFWSWISRELVSVKDVSFGLPLFFAFMIEMVTAFGPLGIVSYAAATRATDRDMSRPVATRHDTSRLNATRLIELDREEMGRVVHYMSDRTAPTTNAGAVGLADLYADYAQWCSSKGLRALSQGEFADEFDRVRELPQLAGKIKKFGTRYFGVAIVESVQQG